MLLLFYTIILNNFSYFIIVFTPIYDYNYDYDYYYDIEAISFNYF